MNEALNKIPNKSSSGPDGMMPVFLKKGGSFITNAIMNILLESLESSYVQKFFVTYGYRPYGRMVCEQTLKNTDLLLGLLI